MISTHHVQLVVLLLFLAEVRFAIDELSQVRMGHGVQLFSDVAVIQTVGEVEGGVASGAQEVGVRSFFQQEFDQREILLVHGQMQRSTTVVLLLYTHTKKNPPSEQRM